MLAAAALARRQLCRRPSARLGGSAGRFRRPRWQGTVALNGPAATSTAASPLALSDEVTADEASNGWIYGYALDGQGGGRKLKPWDDEVCRVLQNGDLDSSEDTVGYWVHLDFKRAKNVAWLWNLVQASGVSGKPGEDEDMGALWLQRLAEEPIVSLPRCEISADGDSLFLSFRSAVKATKEVPDILLVELRFCLTRYLVLTARVDELPEGISLLPEIERNLEDGRGAKTCGQLTASIVAGAVGQSTDVIQENFQVVLALRARFQKLAMELQGARPVKRRELAFLSQHLSLVKYDSTRLLRYLPLQREALTTLLSFSGSGKRKQKVFARADAQRFRKSVETQEAQIQTLNTIGDSAEVLQGELSYHVYWSSAEETYRLTLLGGVASMLIIINICVSLFEFSERRGFLEDRRARSRAE